MTAPPTYLHVLNSSGKGSLVNPNNGLLKNRLSVVSTHDVYNSASSTSHCSFLLQLCPSYGP